MIPSMIGRNSLAITSIGFLNSGRWLYDPGVENLLRLIQLQTCKPSGFIKRSLIFAKCLIQCNKLYCEECHQRFSKKIIAGMAIQLVTTAEWIDDEVLWINQ